MLHTLLSQWQPFLAVFLLLFFLTWESFAPFFTQEQRLRHGIRNVTISVTNAIIIVGLFAGVTIIVADFAKQQQIGLLYWLGLDGVAQIIVGFLLVDIWTYWWHRFNHVVPFLWRFHRMHHSDPSMDVTTATRFHLGEIIFSSIIRIGLILLLGLPIGSLILFDFVQLPIISFHHANIHLPRKLDTSLAYLIVTPFMHKVHHSRIQPETDSNFSSVLSIWDRVFGSYRERDDYHAIQFGLNGFDEDEKQNLKGLFATPFAGRREE